MEAKEYDNFFQGSIFEGCYIVSIYDSTEDEKLEILCDNTVKTAHSKNLRGVIFSFVNVNIIDSYTIKLFTDVTKVISLLGLKVVWTGLKPGVISSILDFGIDLEGVRISQDIQHGIRLIKNESYVTS